MKRCLAPLAVMLFGCSHHIRINEKTADPAEHFEARPTYLADAEYKPDCPSGGVRDVRITSSYGRAWLSVITFGQVNAYDVSYSCAPVTGVVPTPTPTPDNPDGGW